MIQLPEIEYLILYPKPTWISSSIPSSTFLSLSYALCHGPPLCLNTYMLFSGPVLSPFKPSGFFLYHQFFTFKNSTWYSLCVECFVQISEQTATFALYIINWLVYITMVESVYCALQTDSLYNADYISFLKVNVLLKCTSYIYFALDPTSF